MRIDNLYDIGEIVYLKTDSEQKPRIIGSISIFPTGLIYMLSCGVNESRHYELEISTEKDIVFKLENAE